jgi:uncharacterized repeat protein (TIGR03803 family)
MQSKKRSIVSAAVLAIVTVALLGIGTGAVAQQEKVLHSFNNNGTDGYATYTSLTTDAAGNLYGTTHDGGPYSGGTVFELSPKAGGGWTETVLYAFSNGTDGAFPSGSLILDTAGNLYGTTSQGNGTYAGGLAFELSPSTSSYWTETVLHVFGNGTDGSRPSGSLVFDASGNLYGTTVYGGTGDCGGSGPVCGTVFELTSAAGGWAETVIYDFSSLADGFNPTGNLILDASGNLFGMTFLGGSGAYGNGNVFELKRTRSGSWIKGVLHSFGNVAGDGSNPVGGLIMDSAGNLYGTTSIGGSATTCGGNGCGTVFELSPKTGGGWAEKILHNFSANGIDGFYPNAGLVLDAAGHLYGTTQAGGNSTNCGNGYYCGTVFALVSKAGGGWTGKVLHNFSNNGTDGTSPQDSLIFGKAGNLYGTALGGGVDSYGVVFEIKP